MRSFAFNAPTQPHLHSRAVFIFIFGSRVRGIVCQGFSLWRRAYWYIEEFSGGGLVMSNLVGGGGGAGGCYTCLFIKLS